MTKQLNWIETTKASDVTKMNKKELIGSISIIKNWPLHVIREAANELSVESLRNYLTNEINGN